MKIWERQPKEGDKAYSAFVSYLEMGADRSVKKVSKECKRCASLIYRWYEKFDWTKRAAAYDSQIVEERRLTFGRRYNDFLDRQFRGNELIQTRALEIFEAKDLSKISWKSWIELYRTNCAEMLEIAKSLGIAGDTAPEININITRGLPEGKSNDDK